MRNNQLIGDIEARLFQIESMARVVMDSLNYKNEGYDEPFISNADMGNLMWAIADLANDTYIKIKELELKEDCHHV